MEKTNSEIQENYIRKERRITLEKKFLDKNKNGEHLEGTITIKLVINEEIIWEIIEQLKLQGIEYLIKKILTWKNQRRYLTN